MHADSIAKAPCYDQGAFLYLFSIYPILVMLIIFKIVLPIQNLLYYEKRIEFNFTQEIELPFSSRFCFF